MENNIKVTGFDKERTEFATSNISADRKKTIFFTLSAKPSKVWQDAFEEHIQDFPHSTIIGNGFLEMQIPNIPDNVNQQYLQTCLSKLKGIVEQCNEDCKTTAAANAAENDQAQKVAEQRDTERRNLMEMLERLDFS